MNSILAQLYELWKNEEHFLDVESRVNHWFLNLNETIMTQALETFDKMLYSHYFEDGWRVDRKEKRTVQFLFGKVTFKRRRLRKDGEKSFLPLDPVIGIKKYQRYSENTKKSMAQLGAQMPFRQAEKALDLFPTFTASHSTIHKITREVGDRMSAYLDERLPKEKKQKRKVDYVFIEGDEVMLKGRNGDNPSLHRMIIHEGVNAKKKRHYLINEFSITSVVSSKDAFKKAARYLYETYDLTDTIVLSNSDGGPGYGVNAFEDCIGKCARHEHFRDKFHRNEKIRQRIGFDKKMQRKLISATEKYDWKKVNVILHTVESRLPDDDAYAKRLDDIDKLKKYLERNWEYSRGFAERGLKIKRGVGICETGHRYYSYRLKHQGRAWSDAGVKSVSAILNVAKNKELDLAFKMGIQEPIESLGEDLKGAARHALKKIKTDTTRVQTGTIALNVATSSFMGQIKKAFSL